MVQACRDNSIKLLLSEGTRDETREIKKKIGTDWSIFFVAGGGSWLREDLSVMVEGGGEGGYHEGAGEGAGGSRE